MESSYPLDENFAGSGTALNSEIRGYLRETAKWGKFLSILGFISVGLMVLAGVFMGTIGMSSMNEISNVSGQPNPFGMLGGGFVMVLYSLMGLLYFFPSLYLYRFSTKTKLALAQDDQAELTAAFMNMKSVFKFWGVFMAVILGFYALVFVFALIFGGFAAMMM